MQVELNVIHAAVLGLAALTLLWAAGSDLARFRIPNLASLCLLLLFPLFIATAPAPVPWEKHLLIFAVVFTLGYALYAKRLAGAGDIKLLAVLSLWSGPSFWFPFLCITAFAGGLLSLVFGLLAYLRHRASKSEEPLALAKTPIPYGVAIAVGGLCALAFLSHPDLLTKV